jgi:hypothetical protein
MRAARLAARVLAFAPLLAGALLVEAHAVDVPLGDDWVRAELFGTELPQYDSPAPLPSLVARANARWLGGDLRLAMALGFAWVVVASLCVHGLLRRSFADDALSLYTLTFLANLLLFSPVQWEAFLWAARAWSFFPFAAVCLALWIAGLQVAGALKVGLFVALAAACAAVVSLPTYAADPAGPIDLLALLGQPFARTTLLPLEELARALGVAVVALLAAGAVACLRDAEQLVRAAPWLVLGVVAGAACVAVGFFGGEGGVLLSRFATPPLYLCLAALPLAALGAAALRRSAPALRPALAWAPAFGCGVLGVAIGLGWLAGFHAMQEWRSARLQARTSLVFLERFAPLQQVRLAADLPLHDLRRAARVLDRNGQLRPGLAEGDGLGPFEPAGELPEAWGDVESAWVSGPGLELAGFAWLPGAGRRADGVLVTARDGSGPRRLVAVAELDPMPLPPIPEHDHIYNHARIPGSEEQAPWRVQVPADALPEGDVLRVEAFAADSAALRLQRLAHQVELRRTPTGLSARLWSATP